MSEILQPSFGSEPAGQPSPLDALPEESTAAHEAFLAYIEGKKGRRSVKALAQELGGSEHTFAEWCTKFHWRARRRAYFAGIARKKSQAETAAALDQVQLQRLIEQQFTQMMHRLIESSGELLEHKLQHHAQDFKIRDVLYMIHRADQLGRTKRAKPPEVNTHAELRKELMAVGEYVKEQQRLKEVQAKAQAAQIATPNSLSAGTPDTQPAAGSMPINHHQSAITPALPQPAAGSTPITSQQSSINSSTPEGPPPGNNPETK